jgi:beta-N-acetylhexosaminidase
MRILYAPLKLKSAVESGEISEKRIDESVKRILQLKDKYELNHNQIDYQDIQKIND